MRGLLVIFFLLLTPQVWAKKKILVVLSSAKELLLKNNKTVPTGVYFNELVVPVKTLEEKGFEVIYATPEGKAAVIDQTSIDQNYFDDAVEFTIFKNYFDKSVSSHLEKPKSLKNIIHQDLKKYQGLFVPGGHAPIMDLTANKDLAKILTHFHTQQKPTALICHGPLALLSNSKEYKGYKITVFSSEEEKRVVEKKFKNDLVFMPEDMMKKRGFNVVTGTPGSSVVVRFKELITGQNPKSDTLFTEVFLEALEEKSKSLR